VSELLNSRISTLDTAELRQSIIESLRKSGLLNELGHRTAINLQGDDLLSIINLKSGLIIKKYCI